MKKKVFTFIDGDYVRYAYSPTTFYTEQYKDSNFYHVKAASDKARKDAVVAVGSLKYCEQAVESIWNQLRMGKDIIDVSEG